ncbi:MAG: tRNA(m5U54)methyltransferase [Piccolia ochrophora]|nr:MAG: tRNA(m5U54)methyltransferase [Piccolia ochrophora]
MARDSGRGKRPSANTHLSKKRKLDKPAKDGLAEDVLVVDVDNLRKQLDNQGLSNGSGDADQAEDTASASEALPDAFTEIDLTVNSISSTGDGLALSPSSNHIYVVPFTAPGDKVTAKIYKHFEQRHYSLTDLVKVLEPSSLRDDSRIKCPYFATCSGCQLQMLSYPDQLAHKKTIIEKAYRNFSSLAPGLIPPVEDIIGSPMQYGYRTKLTPHFDGPPGPRRPKPGQEKKFAEVPPIGFMKKGTRHTIDIEDCPIGTDVIRKGIKLERQRVVDQLDKYKRGATLLLRESTQQIPKSDSPPSSPSSAAAQTPPSDLYTIKTTAPTHTIHKTCITDSSAIAVEHIDTHVFHTSAGSFFQNNASILPSFTSYIRDHILPTPPPPASPNPTPPYHLIDAYSGSGLFTITLSSLFASSTGIDISPASIKSARHNAHLNNTPNATFIAADAAQLFASVTTPPERTVVVIDPPRKGCDDAFLRQLLAYAPLRVVYVSCNVHTQARDVGVLVRGSAGGVRYGVEKIGGFDFFPQTGHVEGVAFLSREDGRGEVGKVAEAVGTEREGGPGDGTSYLV